MTETLGLYGSESTPRVGRTTRRRRLTLAGVMAARLTPAPHVLASDLAHYSAESLRHLVCSATPGGFDTNPGKGLADAWSTSTVLGIAIPTDIATDSPAEFHGTSSAQCVFCFRTRCVTDP